MPDNLNIPGPADRIWVNATQSWEVKFFVDHYLQSRNYAVNENNRQIVMRDLHVYPERPINRADLERYLDGVYA